MNETHPANPRVRRDENGIWGGAEVAVMPWEDPGARVVVPAATKARLGISEDVLRWSTAKHDRVRIEHAHDARYIDDPTRWLATAWFIGRDTSAGRERDLIVIAHDERRWIKIVVGYNALSKGYQMVTIYATGSEKTLRKWMRNIAPMRME